MPRDTGAQILQIQPQEDLGYAADTAIPVVAKDQTLSEVNKTAQDIMLFDHQNNLTLYNQKIKDRDALLNLFAEGQVSTGKILDGDKHYYEEKEKEMNEAYKGIKGMNDRPGISNYLQKHQELKDLVTNLQIRWTSITGLEKELSEQTLPEDQDAYKKYIAEQYPKKPGELINPFQKAFSMDYPDMVKSNQGKGMGAATIDKTTVTRDAKGNVVKSVTQTAPAATGKGKTATATATAIDSGGMQNVEPAGAYDPKTDSWDPTAYSPEQLQQQATSNTSTASAAPEGYIQVTPETSWNLDDVIKNTETNYLTNKKQAENQRQWFQKFHTSPKWLQKDLITRENAKLRQYVSDKGIDPNSQKGQNALHKFHLENPNDPNSRLILDEGITDFAAKSSLAAVDGPFVQKATYQWDEKRAKFNLDVQKVKNELENDRGLRTLKWADWNLDKDKFESANKEAFAGAAGVLNQAISTIRNGVVVEIEGSNEKVLRISDPDVLKSFKGISLTKDGKDDPPDALDYNPEKNQVNLVYYDTKPTNSGKNIIVKSVQLDQRAWLKQIAKNSLPNKDIGKINTYIDDVLEKNGGLYKLSQKDVQGKIYQINGKTFTEERLAQAAKKYGMTTEDYKKSLGIQ